MNNKRHQLYYAPQYSDLIYLGVFLIGSGTIGLLKYPFFIPLVWVGVIGGIYYFIKEKPKVYFFDDIIEIRKGFGKILTKTIISYSDVLDIQYCIAEIRGNNLFKIKFMQNSKTHTLQYSFMGRPTQYEVFFFVNKGIQIKITPESKQSEILLESKIASSFKDREE